MEADLVVRTVIKDLGIVEVKTVSHIAYMIVCFGYTFLSDYARTTSILMDCTLIPTVYKCRVTYREHKKFFQVFFDKLTMSR